MEFIKLVESLSGLLLTKKISIIVLLDEHETNVLRENKIANVTFRDLSDYNSKTALQILDQEHPDLIVTDNDQEPVRGAFVITARTLNIPVLILREIVMVTKPKFDQMFMLIARKTGEFPRIFIKYFFCFRSILEIKPAYFLNLSKVIGRFIDHLSNPTAGEFADYILTSTEEDAKLLRKLCNRPRFIRAVGDARFDAAVNQSPTERMSIREEIKRSFNIPANKKIILFLSSSQVEHGMWTLEQKKRVNEEIFDLLAKFRNHAHVIVKLHPVEKNIFPLIWKTDYDNVIHVTNSDLSHLIAASDLVITWVSTAMINVVLSRIPMVVIDFFNDGLMGGILLSTQAIVEKGAAVKAINSQQLSNWTQRILEDEIFSRTLKSRQDAFDCNYLKAIDGKSIERVSETIIEIMNR